MTNKNKPPHKNLLHVGGSHIDIRLKSHCPSVNTADNMKAIAAIRNVDVMNVRKFFIYFIGS